MTGVRIGSEQPDLWCQDGDPVEPTRIVTVNCEVGVANRPRAPLGHERDRGSVDDGAAEPAREVRAGDVALAPRGTPEDHPVPVVEQPLVGEHLVEPVPTVAVRFAGDVRQYASAASSRASVSASGPRSVSFI